MKSVILFLLILLLPGCGGGYYGPGRSYGGGSVDVDDLVQFQSSFADKSPSARAEECRRMLRYQQQSPQPGWALRLMIGRPLSEACGEPGRLVRSYESLRSKRYLGRGAEGMGNYYAKLLQRLNVAGGARSEPTSRAGKDDAKLLREKLEAIRAIEKEMDERNAGDSAR
jgi:hypothetical protein